MATSNEVQIHLRVNNRELDTIIAALRLWQRVSTSIGGPEQDIATEHGCALAPVAIDRLIERIN